MAAGQSIVPGHWSLAHTLFPAMISAIPRTFEPVGQPSFLSMPTDKPPSAADHQASAADWRLAIYFPSFPTSTLPFRYAPSSMAIRWVAISPITIADFFNSTRSVAWRLPSSFPCTMTPFASTLAFTCPFGPTVRLFPFSRMLPSTWPSRYKSSLPVSSPLITTDFPMCANSPVFGTSMSALLGRIAGDADSATGDLVQHCRSYRGLALPWLVGLQKRFSVGNHDTKLFLADFRSAPHSQPRRAA